MQIDVIHDSRHLCTRLRSGEGAGGWGGGKQLNRSANTRNRGRLKDNNGKLWVEVIIVTYQMQ